MKNNKKTNPLIALAFSGLFQMIVAVILLGDEKVGGG